MAKATKIAATPAPTEATTKDYIVTEKAPTKVAGRRVQSGDFLSLTVDQAQFEELAGHIREKLAEPASSGE